MGSMCQVEQNKQLQRQDQIKAKDDFTSKLQFYTLDYSEHGQIQIYQYKEHFISKIVSSFQQEQQMKSQIKLLSCLTQFSKNLPFVYKIQMIEKGSCSDKFLIIYYVSHYTYTLGQYLLNTLKKQKLFKNGQIWYILKSLAQTGHHLQNRRICIKRFSRNRIWISPTFQIKLDINDLLPYKQKNQSLNSFQAELFAPQEMGIYANANYQKDHKVLQSKKKELINPFKARVFSLGMMIIECYTGLDSIIGYYNFRENNIDLKSLNRDIKQISDKYLASILSRMLQLNPQKRLQFREVLELTNACSNFVDFQQSLNIS